MQVSATAFKAYDIRGITPTHLNADLALALGRAFGTLARSRGETTVAVGRDGRLSGPALAGALMQGLQEAGIQVIDIGMATTPMLYFAASTLCSSGIQVTGSHNPRDHNGFKMVLAGQAVYGDHVQALRRQIEAEDWVLQAGGSCQHADVFAAYRERIASHIQLQRPIKVVVDSGNGIAGASAPDILRAIGCEVVELFSTVDGNFPNHHPDPSRPENLVDLVAAVKTTGAELGLAFDGDGDRLGVVTREGTTIHPDRLMMLFARDVLARVPGGTVVFDVKCSQHLAPVIAAAGGQPLMFKTGHSLIKAKMREVDSPFSGEMSGHIFFKERWYGFDDGTYTACRLLEIVCQAADASAPLNALPDSFATPEIHVPYPEGYPPVLVAQLIALAAFPAPAVVSTIDGLRVDWPDGFCLMRASNTTPVLVLRFEGHTQESMQRIQAEVTLLIQEVDPAFKL